MPSPWAVQSPTLIYSSLSLPFCPRLTHPISLRTPTHRYRYQGIWTTFYYLGTLSRGRRSFRDRFTQQEWLWTYQLSDPFTRSWSITRSFNYHHPWYYKLTPNFPRSKYIHTSSSTSKSIISTPTNITRNGHSHQKELHRQTL